MQDALERAVIDPALEAAMTGLIRRIAIGQILPGRAGPQHPENPVQHVPRIAPRPAAAIAPQAGFRHEWREDRPLRVREVHAVEVRRRS